MHFIAGNPFAPDAASDWWNFAVNVLIGLATLAALITTIRQSRHASDESARAQVLANDALAREAAREATSRREALVNRAARQATAVTASVLASSVGDRYQLHLDVRNDSDGAVRDVEVTSVISDGRNLTWHVSRVPPNGSQRANHTLEVDVHAPDVNAVRANLTITLTDVYRDRWRITPDGRVTLIGSAEVIESGSA